ncbi:MAG: nitrilase, partial [Oscillospiraceae bacterium]
SPARAGDRRALWMKFLPARAYDSRIFLACCNLLGDNGMGTVFSGGAMAFSPDGGLLAEDFSGKEGLLLVSLSDAALRPYRQTARASMSATYFPAGRRPELYHL